MPVEDIYDTVSTIKNILPRGIHKLIDLRGLIFCGCCQQTSLQTSSSKQTYNWACSLPAFMQEQVQHNTRAQTTHTPHCGSYFRVKLSAKLLDPLCHGLGHSIYRLAMTTNQSSSVQTTGRQNLSESTYAQSASTSAITAASSTQSLLELVTGTYLLSQLLASPGMSCMSMLLDC